MTNTTKNIGIAFFIASVLTFLAWSLGIFALPVQASVPVSNEYLATTTNATYPTGPSVLIRTGQGSLAQVVITGKNTGTMSFYNATTSDVNKRTGQPATSTILIADFPANAPEGTYTFDVQYTAGLLMILSGAPATSTVAYR